MGAWLGRMATCRLVHASDFAWVVLAALPTTSIAGAIAAVIMKPHEAWKDVVEPAAGATGVIMVIALVALVAYSSNEHGDQEPAVQKQRRPTEQTVWPAETLVWCVCGVSPPRSSCCAGSRGHDE